MQGADDFCACGYFTGSLEFAEALGGGRDDFGEVLLKREGLDLVKQRRLASGIDTGAKTLNKGRILLQGGV